jgi:1-aminocyclopropane-1-carboxylate deaminase/D-cysteine desulfhydrase-like pyridoxal-dependent ACC family enzyme
MKKRISGLLLAIGIMAFAPATAAAAEVNMGSNVRTQDTVCEAAGNRGGAAALAALVAAAVAADVDVIACDVNVLNNSLNNLLQNADIHVLENILNNSPILSDITIQDIQVLEDGIQISVLDGPIINLP